MRMRLRSLAAPAMAREADPLAAASDIGDRITRAAIWYRGRCNWVGPDASGQRALGPELGGGTAGIALFLAGLHAAGGDPAARATALGALAHALGHADRAPARGLMTGRLGIAYATARCAALLDAPQLVPRGAGLVLGAAGAAAHARAVRDGPWRGGRHLGAAGALRRPR